MSLTTTTCDDEDYENYVVFDQSSTIDSVTLGRLLVKLSQKQKKSKSRARIRYRLSTRFDLRNLNYATENEPETGENSDFEEIAEQFEETTEEEENISFVREGATPLSLFEETSVERFDIVEHTASQGPDRKALLVLINKLMKFWLMGLLLLLFLFYLCSITFHEDHCTHRNRSCALDGYVELSRMG